MASQNVADIDQLSNSSFHSSAKILSVRNSSWFLSSGLVQSGWLKSLLIIAVLLCLGVVSLNAEANALRLTFDSQKPVNPVPNGQSIQYGLTTENYIVDLARSSDIGVGITIYINNKLVRADSGLFTSAGCSVDKAFPFAWACNDLPEGATQTINFTWTKPTPDTDSVIEFLGSCQLVPVQKPRVACSSANTVQYTSSVGNTGRIEFTSAKFSVNEGAGTATITARRLNGSNGSLTAQYVATSLTGDTASPGSMTPASGFVGDYSRTKGTLTWAHGDNSTKSFTVSINDDTLVEGNETLSLAIGDASFTSQAKLTIVDNDAYGELQFSTANYSVNENGGNASIAVNRVNGSSGPISVQFATRNGTAVAGNDYTATNNTLYWAAGDTAAKTIVVPILNDNIFESNETIFLDLSNPTLDGVAGPVLGNPASAKLTIIDSSIGSIRIVNRSYSVNENAGVATIGVERINGVFGPMSMEYGATVFVGDTATAAADFTEVSGVFNWRNGEGGVKTFDVPINNDSLVEGDEVLTVYIGIAGEPNDFVPLTILDNDSYGRIRLSSATYTVNENGGSASIIVERINGTSGGVSVNYATSDGTAIAPGDYTSQSGKLIWAAGDGKPKTFSIPINPDDLIEGDETVRINLSRPAGGASLGRSAADLTIKDIVAIGTIRFKSTTYSVNEDGGNATIIVERVNGVSGAVSVNYATADGVGTATVVDDYSSVSGSLNWGIGQGGERSFTIPIHDDILIEGNETVALRLSNAAGGATLGRSVADLNIVDTETIGDIQFTTTNYSVDETGGNATISVERINGNSGSVSVDYATADGVGTATNGADYTTTSGTLTWPAGSSSVMTFTIPISADDLVEGDETVALRLSNATGGATLGRNVADLTIRDIVSIGEIQFQSVSYSVNENGGSATISVERVNGVTGAVSVDYATADVPGGATAGSDYQATSGGLSWKAGEGGTKTFTVSITDDALVENNETLDLLLSKPTGGAVLGAQSSARLTITDNDRQQVNPGVLEFDVVEVSVDEDAGTVSLTVNRLNGSDGAISVDYVTGDQTATAGGDYSTATGTLEWADGDSRSKQISIPILADSAIENDETFELQLSNTTGGATIGALNPATITILDSQGGNADTSPQAISAMSIEKVSGADQNATSGQLLPFVIKVWDANANPSVGEAVTWTVTPAGAGTLSNDASTTTGADGQSSNTFTVNQNRIIKITATAQQGTAVFVVNSLAGKAGLSSNQRSAGRALDAACPTLADITSPTSDQQDMLNVCESLNTASDSDIATALTQMAHDDLASQGSMMVEYSLGQLSQIDVRMAELRGGATGINLSGLSFDVLGQPIPNIVFASLWETAQGGGASADEPPGMPSRWGGFINGNISVGDKDPTTNEPGFDLKANGITLGADYRLSNDMIVGGAIGFISSKSDLNASAGDQEVDGISLSAYGTFYQSESIYIDGILSLGQNDFTSRRNMTFGTLNQTAVGDTSGNEIAISIGGGYDMNRDALSFGPYGRIDYVNVDIDGFDEKPSNPGGAGSGLMLSVDSQSVEMMTAMVGGQMIYTYSTAIGVIAPQLKLEWAHEFMDDSRIINAHFANDPTISTFGITTDDPDRDYFNLGLGVTGTFANGKSAYLMYETVLDRDHVNVYSIAFGGRMEF